MNLPLLALVLILTWVVCGFWFHDTAKRINAKPWLWIVGMFGSSLIFVWLFSGLEPTLLRLYVGLFPDRSQYAPYADWLRYFFGVLVLANIGFIAALRYLLLRISNKVPTSAAE